jgi:hypothetical protein
MPQQVGAAKEYESPRTGPGNPPRVALKKGCGGKATEAAAGLLFRRELWRGDDDCRTCMASQVSARRGLTGRGMLRQH